MLGDVASVGWIGSSGSEKFDYPFTLTCRRGVDGEKVQQFRGIMPDEGVMLLSRGKL